MPYEESKKIISIIGVIIVIAILSFSIIIVIEPFKQNTKNNQKTTINIDYDNSTYTNLTTEEAYHLIQTEKNLSIFDIRGLEGCSSCQFNRGHLQGAEMNLNPKSLYNSTNDILVYSKDGSKGAIFCSELIGHVYADIYNLDGGYNAWVADGYEVEKY